VSLSRDKLMLEMIQDELELGEPYNYVKWLWITWFLVGAFSFRGEFKKYYQEACQVR
jgi:hypothetical protein